jgi:C-terminal processing protease CtpA/Prc
MPPTAVPGAEGRIMMAGGAYLSIRISNPQAYRGVGITSFEQRPGELLVVSVETHSPAGRAGIVPGDRIIAIGAETIDALGPQRAAGALSMASDRHAALRVRNERGVERTVELDRGYTWHVR